MNVRSLRALFIGIWSDSRGLVHKSIRACNRWSRGSCVDMDCMKQRESSMYIRNSSIRLVDLESKVEDIQLYALQFCIIEDLYGSPRDDGEKSLVQNTPS